MDRLDLNAQLGARAFLDRQGSVHLRNRFSGEVFCGATEDAEPHDDLDAVQPLADGPTPEELGASLDEVERWPWCEECRILGRGAGIIVYVPEQTAAVEP